MSVAVETRDLFRVYSTPEGDAAALQGLTLTIAEGEILTVLGPSGSGKTSFLRILAGLDTPSAGTARVFGRDLRGLGFGGLARYPGPTHRYPRPPIAPALAPPLCAPAPRRRGGRAGGARTPAETGGLAGRRAFYELGGGGGR